MKFYLYVSTVGAVVADREGVVVEMVVVVLVVMVVVVEVVMVVDVVIVVVVDVVIVVVVVVVMVVLVEVVMVVVVDVVMVVVVVVVMVVLVVVVVVVVVGILIGMGGSVGLGGSDVLGGSDGLGGSVGMGGSVVMGGSVGLGGSVAGSLQFSSTQVWPLTQCVSFMQVTQMNSLLQYWALSSLHTGSLLPLLVHAVAGLHPEPESLHGLHAPAPLHVSPLSSLQWEFSLHWTQMLLVLWQYGFVPLNSSEFVSVQFASTVQVGHSASWASSTSLPTCGGLWMGVLASAGVPRLPPPNSPMLSIESVVSTWFSMIKLILVICTITISICTAITPMITLRSLICATRQTGQTVTFMMVSVMMTSSVIERPCL